jgi:thiol peroxidase
VNLSGNEVNVGDKAPEVTLIATDLSEIKVGGGSDKTQLLVIVPSLDTDVCATETRHFNQQISMFGTVDITVASMDLPFASKRFCSTEGIDELTVASDYVDKELGKSYGVLIADGPLKGLLARAIFVINEEGIVTYKEIVPEITSEPDYDKVVEALKDA